MLKTFQSSNFVKNNKVIKSLIIELTLHIILICSISCHICFLNALLLLFLFSILHIEDIKTFFLIIFRQKKAIKKQPQMSHN